ncbi:HD-GYP domain-containing protein [Methylobacterium iners]|uniref:HD-GYP domain-containing protein n=1 Tax=Methylobacterium iners TaxID=418707 RepID=A0ABQ4S1W3_9HYPH|nr:HD domain-containing phosphohydrolase [Methylobacterium iners]GJD96469.1 hypothetical protein OCOJLMKI_3690 [Methylobacterium iners]
MPHVSPDEAAPFPARPQADSILILTDTPARGERLAREFSVLAPCLVLDLLDPDQRSLAPPADVVRAVVSDASLVQSAVIAGLRRQLDRLKVAQPSFLCLLNEETSRSRLQADVLGATRILRSDAPGGEKLRVLASLVGATPPSEVEQSIAAAEAAISRIFDVARGGLAIKPELIATGTRLVEQAIRVAGIRDWLDIVWRFDDATHQHCLLVAGLAAGFGRSLGLAEADCERLTQAALLHDIGKAKVPEHILNKPAALAAEDREIMQRHPGDGHAMLLGGGFSDEILSVVRSHHECLDGSGYPDGLQGADIPDLVRLVSICDVYGALIERRAYRAPMAAERAYGILESMSRQLDRHLVRAFRSFAVQADARSLHAPA